MRLGSIILTGGKSDRMGKPKASLPFGDNTLLGRTVDTLLSCSHPVVVVARNADQIEAELPPIPVEADIIHDGAGYQGQGPLAGLLAGLEHLHGRCTAAFLTGCDVPFLTPAAVEWLAEQLGDHDMVIPEVAGVLQPLCSIYRTDLAAAVRKALATDDSSLHGSSLHGLARSTNARVLTEAEVSAFDTSFRFLQGVNNPEEYQAALREAGLPEPHKG